jgi:S-adenosylmethionine synthetase
MAISVSSLTTPTVHTLPFELVERKGLGHPDTICDALAEMFSRGLSRFYLARFGEILHHNVDKAFRYAAA